MLIKVCGMRDPENIRQVAMTGIDWMGFIFYARSARSIDSRQWTVDSLKKTDSPSNCQLSTVICQLKRVGVFVNATPEYMMETANLYKLDYLQLHGNESPDTCYALQKRGYAIIKAFSIASADDLTCTTEYEERTDYFLFDTKCNSYGGSGKQFDWSVLASYKGNTPFLLSGGIAPDSVDAVRNFRHPQLAGIDLNSGFETEPGMKDAEKIKTFIDKIKK
ncbi:phosphoribosylanthranilate isomerase [Parabacteroides sp. AF18-52]|jgi:phosphoribosylanthranilate isomerase|uniref:phosphoribosylanthranilate isomerase n=1 Tax=Parabacteroides sp. AF18-52 TaxID=2292242 RepID=UPI000EFF0D92|nr:phosphoribosylanthranilate isomerase [Parabacteroides sp. AF18-52]RHR41047.1 phosphoribosylanthranilate isomerase [Parabacteroides sp. AF18-52]